MKKAGRLSALLVCLGMVCCTGCSHNQASNTTTNTQATTTEIVTTTTDEGEITTTTETDMTASAVKTTTTTITSAQTTQVGTTTKWTIKWGESNGETTTATTTLSTSSTRKTVSSRSQTTTTTASSRSAENTTATTATVFQETTTSKTGGTTTMTKQDNTQTTVTAESTSSTRKTVPSRTKTTVTTAAHVDFPVKPKYESPQLSAAAVNNRIDGVKTKIKSERSLVAEYDPDWAFAHQNGITYFKGKYYVGWSSGVRHEDAAGQRILVASSSDNCQTWSEPTVVAVPEMGTYGQKALLFAQFVATDDMLYVYFIEHEYGESHFDSNGKFIAKDNQEIIGSRSVAVFTSDGVNWTEQIEFGGNSNESPRQSLTGRWFSGAGNGLNIWDDEGEHRVKWSNLSAQQVADARSRGAQLLTEASWYQTDDYVIHMMLRAQTGYVWMSESYDNGETWTDAYPTCFTTDHAMFNFGRLPDGRYYFVGNSTMEAGTWRRYPLELFVSEDGYNFNKAYILRDEKYQMQQQGWSKGGYFGYPEVFIHDGYMHISYSKEKEVIEVTRVKLSDI